MTAECSALKDSYTTPVRLREHLEEGERTEELEDRTPSSDTAIEINSAFWGCMKLAFQQLVMGETRRPAELFAAGGFCKRGCRDKLVEFLLIFKTKMMMMMMPIIRWC